MITKTTINNVKKYLDEKNIPFENFKNDLQLFEFAKTIRNKEKIAYMKEEKQSEGMKKIEISIILKTELWDERFFYSEGIQIVDYSKYNNLFLNFVPGEILFNFGGNLTGPNYFEFFSYFIDVYENYCQISTNEGKKTISKRDLTEIFKEIKLYVINEHLELLEKLMIKEFLKDCLYKKQTYQIREERRKEIIESFKINKNH